MTDRRSWRWEVTLFLLVMVSGVLIGTAFERPLYGALAGMALMLAIWVRDLYRMTVWVRNPDLEPPFRAGVWGEITDALYVHQRGTRKMITEQAERLELLQASYSALPDAVVLIDVHSQIRWCNRPAEKLLGLRYPGDVGVPLCDLLRLTELEQFLDNEAFDEPLEISSPRQQSVPLEVRAGRFGQGSKVVFFRNIETYKRLESMRQDFVSSMSHEMRTPLTVISGYLDTLESVLTTESPVVVRVLDQMRGQARRMENLLRDLMLLSRLEVDGQIGSDDEELIVLCAMLESIIENARTSCDGRRQISLNCGAVSGSFLARRVELESIFSNLIFNAVKYTHDGGVIDVSLTQARDGAIVFAVKDDGIGIDPHHIPRLTERFYRADKSRSVERGGTGLGLAIVKHALRHVNGELAIESYPDKGSTFSCTLPADRYSESVCA